MALVLCPVCGKQISDRARSCPHCGSRIKRDLARRKTSEAATQRSWNETWLALLLLVGFLLPVVSIDSQWRTQLHFTNLALLSEADVSLPLKFLALYPCIAAIMLMVLVGTLKSAARSLGFIALGITPLLVRAIDRDARMALSLDVDPDLYRAIAMFAVAWIGIFVGTRALQYRERSVLAAAIAILAGSSYLAVLVVPIAPETFGRIWLVSPFKLLLERRTILVGLGSLCVMLCMMTASVVCLVGPFVRNMTGRLAGKALGLLVAGLVLYGLSLAGGLSTSMYSLAAAIKYLCLVVGLYLLMPIGLADFVIGVIPEARLHRVGRRKDDATKRLEFLQQMLERGMIPQDEYEAKKREILSEI